MEAVAMGADTSFNRRKSALPNFMLMDRFQGIEVQHGL
jgi:hypothetical protein